jgi:hypothetical protein
VLLILTGAVYAVLGIRYKYFHVFFSAAYLASLAVAILIVYVMSLPVSTSIQGAYVAATAVSGIVVGGAALVLVDMMQGLGCLLGGFTFSMWLLVLKPGGLLTSKWGRVGFITGLTLAGFSTSFSHITRPYGLIVFTSFSGSTAIILGIDCFSRAGLKEFWVYLWSVNSDLFPIGITTYPLTKGLYAEIAAIIILSIAGILSQTKLWKIIKERHRRREAEQSEYDKAREQEEANIGRDIESVNARDRDEWEAIHGNKDDIGVAPSDKDSGVGDMESQKKGPMSTVTSVLRPDDDEIEMAQVRQSSPPSQTVPTAPGGKYEGGAVAVREVQGSQPESENEDSERLANSMKHRSYVSTKHLSNIEVPNLADSDLEDPVNTTREVAAPLDGEELHETSESAIVPLEMSTSQISNKIRSAESSSTQANSWLSLSSDPPDDISSSGTRPPIQPQSSQQNSVRSTLSHRIPQAFPEPLVEEDLGPLPPSTLGSRRSSYNPFGGNTLMTKRDSIIRSKTQDPTEITQPQLSGTAPRQGSSGGGSVYDYDYGLPSAPILDDDMPLSTRRKLLRPPPLPSPPPHQARRQYTGPSPVVREKQLAAWRSSLQRERQSVVMPNEDIEKQRSALWQERQVEGQKKVQEKRRKEEKESAFDESTRRGQMLNAHRDAMRKMQALANKHA